MTDTDIILHDHDTGHIITDCDGVCPPAPAPVCGPKYTADGRWLRWCRSWSEPEVWLRWRHGLLQNCSSDTSAVPVSDNLSMWVDTRAMAMYGYNVVYKDTEDDLMFAMEEDEMVRRHAAGSSTYKSSECLCCNSSQLLGLIIHRIKTKFKTDNWAK